MSTSSSAPNPAAPVAHGDQHEDEGCSDKEKSTVVYGEGQLRIVVTELPSGRRAISTATPNDRGGFVTAVSPKLSELVPVVEEDDESVVPMSATGDRKPPHRADAKTKPAASRKANR